LLDKITGDVLMPVERKPFVQELRPPVNIGRQSSDLAPPVRPPVAGGTALRKRQERIPIPPIDFGFGPGIRPTEIRGPDGRIIGPAGVTPPAEDTFIYLDDMETRPGPVLDMGGNKVQKPAVPIFEPTPTMPAVEPTQTTNMQPINVSNQDPFAASVTQQQVGLDPLTEQLLFGIGGKGGFIPGAMRAAEKVFFDEQGNPIVIDEQVAGFSPDQLQAMQMQRQVRLLELVRKHLKKDYKEVGLLQSVP
jgi:hypothetical protein